LSSAILYLAIVAIWAVVLVPRWLRPRPAQPQPAEQQLTDQTAKPQSAAPEALAPEPADAWGPADASAPAGGSGPADGSGPAEPDPGDTSAWAETDGPGPAAEPVPASPSPAARRADILQARRRMLAMIATLTVGAAGLAVTGIAAPWVIIPPMVLLGGFLVLLREASRCDAERGRRTTPARRDGTPPVAGQEPASSSDDFEANPYQVPATASAPGTETAPDAEVIDISARVVDQVYDQYSDAADRAVGD
jgi:hypothetical protein